MTLAEDDLERLREWAERIGASNYYEILGVLEISDAAAIRDAFREFALSFHPDRHRAGSAEERTLCEYVFRQGAEAYRELCDPERRAAYDLRLAQGYLRSTGDVRVVRPESPILLSLEDIARSPAAKLTAKRADERLAAGNLEDARRLLKEALAQDDYENAALEERIEGLDVALFARGDGG